MNKTHLGKTDIKLLSDVHFNKKYTGQSFTIDNSGIIVVTSSVESDHLVCAISSNGIQRIFDIQSTGPILVEYLEQFSSYPPDIRTYLQLAINSEHTPSYTFFSEFKDVLKSRVNPFRKMQSFAFCSNAEINIQDGRFYFVAVTGPSRESSEGTVVGLEEDGVVHLSLLSTWSVHRDITKHLSGKFSDTAVSNILALITKNL